MRRLVLSIQNKQGDLASKSRELEQHKIQSHSKLKYGFIDFLSIILESRVQKMFTLKNFRETDGN